MKYAASIKSYDPDDEDCEDFDTREAAAEWLARMLPYHHNSGNMKVNDESVRFDNGLLVKNEPRVPVAVSLASTNEQFQRLFRPKSVRPTNVSTLRDTGQLVLAMTDDAKEMVGMMLSLLLAACITTFLIWRKL